MLNLDEYIGKYSCVSIPRYIMVRDNIVGPLYDSSKSSTHMEPPKLQWINWVFINPIGLDRWIEGQIFFNIKSLNLWVTDEEVRDLGPVSFLEFMEFMSGGCLGFSNAGILKCY